MAITHEASSGVETTSTAKGTTSTTVAYVGVAAGRLGILTATLKPDTAAFGAVPGWTQLVDTAGGAAEVVTGDSGPTRLGVWTRTLDGTEVGSVTISATGTPDSVVGAMSSYTVTAGWDPLAYVTGTDAAHGSAFSATAGSWAATLAAGDVLVIARSSDSDGIGAKSAPSLTQSGATFAAVDYRNNRLNSSAGDCCVATWDAAVTAGSAAAPTFAHAMTAPSCGALAIVRIRESAAGTVDGDLAVTLPALAAVAAGEVSVTGALAGMLPALVADAEGTSLAAASSVHLVLPAMAGGVVGSLTVSSSLDAALPALTAAAVGAVSVGGVLAASLPALVVAMSDGTAPVATGRRIVTSSPVGRITTTSPRGRL